MWTTVATLIFIYDFLRTDLSSYQIIFLGIGGALSWSFVEYMAHRFFHHYKNPYVANGVSTNLWDFVFGTMARDKDGRIIK